MPYTDRYHLPCIARLAALIAIAFGVSFASAHAAENDAWSANPFPNIELTTQDGKKVRFYDDVIKGKVVSLNFIYTNCGDVCPLDTAQLTQVHALLGDRVGKDVFMYSISIDPDNDTPAALKRYMRMFGVGKGWTFLTGKRQDIVKLQRSLGLNVLDPKKVTDHDTTLMMGNERTGQWIKRTPYDDPKLLAHMLGEVLFNYATSVKGTSRPYDEAKRIAPQSRGAYLFRTRCDSCHTIGEGDRLGPDLAGVVAARPRAWLIRWLKEPDKMLAEKDPIATALKAQYRNVPMPNLSLGDLEAKALIDFMEQKDREAAARASAAAAPARNGGR
jgi:protein SCO1